MSAQLLYYSRYLHRLHALTVDVTFRPIFVIWVTRCYAHFGFPSCLHPCNIQN